ncbi:MAG: glycosyltransferase, partial [Oscillospiraceae bacterium]
MRYDIVLVTYNSINWLNGCVKAIANAKYDLAQLNLIFVDNASCDDTVNMLHQLKLEHSGFGGFEIIQNRNNKGFGAACNLGADSGNSPFIFFLNTDTEVYPDLFCKLDDAAAAHADAVAYECRQLPYEMGHHFDPVTLETSWASGAALLVRRSAFVAIKGFDEHLFMYCEDVDLSWRLRALCGKIYYVPDAIVTHFVLARETPKVQELREYAYTLLGTLLLAWKYGGFKDILCAELDYLKVLQHPKHYDGVRRALCKNYLRHFISLFAFFFWRFANKKAFKAAPWQPKGSFAPERGRAVLEKHLNNGPLISVVVRTCARLSTLRLTLQTLRHQSYRNFEVIVIEDGKATAEECLKTEFSDLNIHYHATGKNIGRGKAGNLGLSLAKGDYCNFLDDDDFFYPDHLELMADTAIRHPNADLILGTAMVMKIETLCKEPYSYAVKEVYSMHFDRVDNLTMCQTCQIPIQSAMFKKTMFLKYGGLREDINANEDWTMWLKYLAHGTRINKQHVDIDRATSIFVLPASEALLKERLLKYKTDDNAFYSDSSLRFDVSLADMREYYKGVMADFEHLYNEGKLEEYFAET